MKKRFTNRVLLLAFLALPCLAVGLYIDKTFHAYAQTGVKFIVQTSDGQKLDASQFPFVNAVTIADRDGVPKIVFLHKLTARNKPSSDFDYSVGIDQHNSLQCTVAGESVSIERYTQVFYAIDDMPIQSVRMRNCHVKLSEAPEDKWNAFVSK